MNYVLTTVGLEFNMIVHKPDKKRDKAVSATLYRENVRFLETVRSQSTQSSALVATIISLLFSRVHPGSWLDIPSDTTVYLTVVDHIMIQARKLSVEELSLATYIQSIVRDGSFNEYDLSLFSLSSSVFR